jgi:phosphoadenosine phosphosulfate reductase
MTASIDLDLRDLVDEGERVVAAVARSGADVEVQAATALAWAHHVFGDRLVIASSMTGEVLVHLASRVVPGIDVLFLDTGYHFAETIGMRDATAAMLPVQVRTALPLLTMAQQDAEHGPRLHERDPDLCCALRKVEPLNRELAGYDAWVSGMRRAETASRREIPIVGWDEKRGMLKLNPLAGWTDEDVDAYVERYDVMLHPLRSIGYASIGCEPCTRPVAPGEDPRAGRWSGTGKTECGIHA